MQTGHGRRFLVVAAWGRLLLVAAPAQGAARPGASRTPKGLTAALMGQLASELAADRDETALAAAKRLGDLGGPAATEALVGGLAIGVRPTVAAEVLGALGKTRDSRALPILVTYAGNINVPVRLAAVRALGQQSDGKAAEVLIDRLGDGNASVRAAAAEALAARKEGKAEKRLFQLVARNDAGAAGPLGAVITPAAIPRLAELHGRVDDAVLATAFGEFLKRPDAPDRLRVDVVRTVGRLPGAAATAALVEYLASVPERDQRPSKEEAQKMIDQRGSK